MTRILSGALVILGIVAWMVWLHAGKLEAEAAALNQSLQIAIEANQYQAIELTRLESEVAKRDGLAKKYRAWQLESDRISAKRLEQLEKMKNEREDFAAYMRSGIHPLASSWMWMQSSGDQTEYSIRISSGVSGGADAKTPISHERGWRWCKETERALDSCNEDKRGIAEWMKSN